MVRKASSLQQFFNIAQKRNMKRHSLQNVNNISVDTFFIDDSQKTPSTVFSLPGWQIAAWAIAYLSIIIVSAVGNSTVIWIILTHKQMRIVPNYFIVNLALSDFLMTALNTVFNFIYASHNVWYFGEGFCQFLNFIPITAVFVSVYSMAAIAAERYVAIVYPFKKKLSPRNSKVIIGIIWLAAIGLAFPQFLYAEIRIDNEITKCIIIWPGDPDNSHKLTYHIALIVLVYLLPLTVMFVLYGIIGITLWNHVVPGDDTNKVYHQHQITAKKRFVRTMVAVMIAFAISWFPYHLFFILGSIWKDMSRKKYIQQVYLTVFLLAMSSAVYSPIMYCCLNQRVAFQWCPCVKVTERDRHNLTQPSALLKIQRHQAADRTSHASMETHTTNSERMSFTNLCMDI